MMVLPEVKALANRMAVDISAFETARRNGNTMNLKSEYESYFANVKMTNRKDTPKVITITVTLKE